MSTGTRDAVDRIVATGGDVDDVLRSVVRLLVSEPGIVWAGIRFVEDGELVLGPAAGSPDETRVHTVPIAYEAAPVGELVVHGDPEPGLLEGIGSVVAPYVLLGWDTGGEAWDP